MGSFSILPKGREEVLGARKHGGRTCHPGRVAVPPRLWNRTPWRDALVPSKLGLLPGGQSPSPAQPSQDPACPLSSLSLPLSPLTWMAPHQPHLAPGELLLHQEQEASPLLPSRRQTGPRGCSKSGHTTQNSSAGAVMTLQPRAGCFSRSLESE